MNIAGLIITTFATMFKSWLSENVIRKLIILLGDEIVNRTKNDVDNRVWFVLREALENRLDGSYDTLSDKQIKEKMEINDGE